jgi:hypothetical protein
LTVTLEHAGRFPGSHHSEKTWSSSQTTLATNDQNTETASSSDSYPPSISSRTTTIASLSEAASRINAQVPFDDEETKDLILCMLYILKNLEQSEYYTELIILRFIQCTSHWHKHTPAVSTLYPAKYILMQSVSQLFWSYFGQCAQLDRKKHHTFSFHPHKNIFL